MKYYEGDGLLNSAINNLPFEMHIPGYNWCGPGTKVEQRLARNDPGVNGLDEACKEHDLLYNKESDLSRRHEADKILKRKALARLKAKDASWKEKLAAVGVAGAMKAKVKLGMGLKVQNQQRAITDCKKKLQKIKEGLLTSLKHVDEVIKNLVFNQESNVRKTSVNINKTKKRHAVDKKIDLDIADDYPMNQIKSKTVNSIKKSRQVVNKKKIDEMDIVNKVQRKRKTIKNSRNNSVKNRQGNNDDHERVVVVEPLEELENIPMDVDITDDYPMNRNQRKRKNDHNGDDDLEQPLCKRSSKLKTKRKVLDMNEPLTIPSRKRKLSATDEEVQIPEKVQVINKE